jgi:hypothetical protein
VHLQATPEGLLGTKLLEARAAPELVA